MNVGKKKAKEDSYDRRRLGIAHYLWKEKRIVGVTTLSSKRIPHTVFLQRCEICALPFTNLPLEQSRQDVISSSQE